MVRLRDGDGARMKNKRANRGPLNTCRVAAFGADGRIAGCVLAFGEDGPTA